ncbi:hypothetical protein AAVH_37004, partial [Aphelenchoides avenae]
MIEYAANKAADQLLSEIQPQIDELVRRLDNLATKKTPTATAEDRHKDTPGPSGLAQPAAGAAVYVIGVHKVRSFLPCVFFLLPGKGQETYRRAFTALFTLPELRDADPASITCDFETAPRNVMQELFPNARIVHCQFHLAQILIKHIQKAGLMDVYCNAEVRPLLRSLWALAFLPPEDVAVAYEGPMVSLNAMIARDVIPQADVQHLN